MEPLPFPLSRPEAEKRVRGLAVDPRKVFFTAHLGERAEDPDRSVTMAQVREVVAKGSVVEDPRWDDDHENWVCVLRRRVSGNTVVVVVAIDDEELKIVTTFREAR